MQRILGTICLGLAVLSAGALAILALTMADAAERFGLPTPVLYMSAFHAATLLSLAAGLYLAGRSLRRAV